MLSVLHLAQQTATVLFGSLKDGLFLPHLQRLFLISTEVLVLHDLQYIALVSFGSLKIGPAFPHLHILYWDFIFSSLCFGHLIGQA
jgi:hypothetical protein